MKNWCSFLLFGLIIMSISPIISAETLRVTQEHPFLINEKWVTASDLKIGNLLTTADGKKAKIIGIKDYYTDNPFLVYNIETNIFHDFVVGSSDIVVHNSNLPRRVIKTIGDIDIVFISKSEHIRAAEEIINLEGRLYWTKGYRDPESIGFAIAAWKNHQRYLGLVPNEQIVEALVFERGNKWIAIAARADTELSQEAVRKLGIGKCNELVGLGRITEAGMNTRMTFEFYADMLSLWVKKDGSADTAIIFEVRNKDAGTYRRVLGNLVEDVTGSLGNSRTVTITGPVSETKIETTTIEVNNLLIRPENVGESIKLLRGLCKP